MPSPFYPGSAADKQSRIARQSADAGQWNSPLPGLIGKDKFFGAPGERWPVDAPNPSFAVLLAQNRVARLSGDAGQWDSAVPGLIGKDTFFGTPGERWPVDAPNPSFTVRAAQSREACVSADIGRYDTPLPSFLGQDKFFRGAGQGPAYDFPNPAFTVPAAQARVARLSADAGQWDAPIPLLVGQVAGLPAGEQSQDLPSRGAPRAREYGQTSFYTLTLIGQDSTGGSQQYNLPPALQRVQPRSVALNDPGANATLSLAPVATAVPPGEQSQDLPPAGPQRARDYSQTGSFPLELIGQDQLTAGEQSQDLPPGRAARARDYSFTASFPPVLIGQDQLAAGEQSQDLPPRAAPRSTSLHDFPATSAALLLSVELPIGQAASDAQYRTTPRARDYTFAATAFQGLAGQDAFATGEQLSGNAPSGVARASSLTDPGANQAIGLSAAAPAIPVGQAYLDNLYRNVPRARDYTFVTGAFQGLLGQDAFNPGAQLSGNTPAGYLRARDYTFTAAFPLELVGQDAVNPGQASLDAQYRAVPRARVYTWLQQFNPAAIGPQQQFPIGQAVYDLGPIGAARARDYTFTAGFFQGLIGQDQFPSGASLSGNAPAAPRRARDYTQTASFPLELIGQDAVNAGAQAQDLPPRAYSRTFALYDPGCNATVTLAQPAGQASLDAQYRTVLRARDYTFTASAFQGLASQDAFNPGAQISGNTPAGARRASTLTETGSNQILGLTALPPVFPCGLASLDQQYRTVPRARDYTFLASFPLELVGKDRFFGVGGPAYDWTNPSFARLTAAQQLAARLSAEVGQWASPLPELVGLDRFFGAPGESQAFDWTPPVRTTPRSFALYDPGFNLTVLLPAASPVGTQATDLLPVRVIARASTLGDPGVNTTSLPLSVSLPVGFQSQDLPAKAALRLKDYSILASFPPELIGKDQLPAGDSTASSELPPKAPARLSDYTWLQSLPLYVYQQLPPGQSTGRTELPPKAPSRLPDYTFLASINPYLIGKDTFFGAPGEVQAFDWQLPPRGPARARDYSFAGNFFRGNGVAPRDLVYIVSSPRAKWAATEIEVAKWRTQGLPPGKWKTGTPIQ